MFPIHQNHDELTTLQESNKDHHLIGQKFVRELVDWMKTILFLDFE